MQKTRSRFLIAAAVVLLVQYLVGAEKVLADDPQSTVYAKGHGTVSFRGTAAITLNGEGTLVTGENARVTFVSEDGTEEGEPECYPTEQGGCVYIDVSGKVYISGDDIEISFTGANIGLNVGGTGTLVMTGYGIYIYKTAGTLKTGRWAGTGTTIVLE